MNDRAVAFLDRALGGLLLVCALALPLSVYLKTFDPLLIKDVLLQGGAILAGALWLSRSLEAGRFELPASRGRIFAVALAALAWTLASLGWNPYPEVSLVPALRDASLLVIFLIALAGPASAGWAVSLADWTLAGAGLAAGYGLLQWAGSDPAPWRGAFGGAAFSTLGEPAVLGVLLAAAWPLAVARALDDESAPPSRYAAAAVGVLLLGAVRASESLAALGALAAGSAAFALRALSASGDRRVKLAALAQAALAAAALAAAPWSGQDERWTSGRKSLEASWRGAREMVAFHPVRGWGAGSFGAVFPDFRPPELARWQADAGSRRHPKSEPLRLAAELGTLGVGLLAVLAGLVLLPGWKDAGARLGRGDSRTGSVSAGLWAACAALGAAGLASDALASPAAGFALAAYAAALAALAREEGSAVVYVLPVPAPPLARLALSRLAAFGAIVLALIPAGLWTADTALNAATAKGVRGEIGPAVAELGRVWLKHPRGAEARYAAARLLSRRNQEGDAAAATLLLAAAESADPGLPRVALAAAEVRFKLADWKGAESDFERGLRRDPSAAESWEKLVELKWILGKKDEARLAALSLLKLDPNDPKRWRLVARTYRELKLPAVARVMERKAARIDELARSGSLPPVY